HVLSDSTFSKQKRALQNGVSLSLRMLQRPSHPDGSFNEWSPVLTVRCSVSAFAERYRSVCAPVNSGPSLWRLSWTYSSFAIIPPEGAQEPPV
ncbi:hypothetical protein GOODEAATRI_010656, partial [Goodea atripinnis]